MELFIKARNCPKNILCILSFSLYIWVIDASLLKSQSTLSKTNSSLSNTKTPLAPYDRGGIPLKEPAELKAQYPQYEPNLGKITAYLTPIAEWIKDKTYYFGTTIVSTPGGILDEILYYTRGMDTVLESSILLISFIIFSWLFFNKD